MKGSQTTILIYKLKYKINFRFALPCQLNTCHKFQYLSSIFFFIFTFYIFFCFIFQLLLILKILQLNDLAVETEAPALKRQICFLFFFHIFGCNKLIKIIPTTLRSRKKDEGSNLIKHLTEA